MLRSVEVTLDAADAEASAAFWAAALGYRVARRRPPYVVLEPPRAGLPVVLVQQVAAPAAGSRAHLDLRVDDPEAEVARLAALGARVAAVHDERAEGGSRWWVLADPAGTPFCLCERRSG